MLKWFSIIVFGAILDQVSKYLALKNLLFGIANPVIPGLNFTLSYNRGIAFGMFSDYPAFTQVLLISIVVLISSVLTVWLIKTPNHQRLQAFSLSLIISGAIGNLIDRVFRGYVVDFVDFYVGSWHWHTFNMADSFICIGGALLIIASFRSDAVEYNSSVN